MDHLTAMRAFIAVADLRGFAPAARRLAISQPTVTRLVAALEAHLAVRLLHRTTRAVGLTDAGARYIERARRILADVTEAEALARKERAEPVGRLVVAAPAVFGRREVAPLFSDFLRHHPALTGSLVLSDQIVNLLEAGVDVAVRIGKLDDSSLRVREVGATRRVLVGSPRYLAARGRPRSPQDLAAHDLIQYTSLSPLAEWHFARRGKALRVPIQPRASTNSADAALLHAERGGGLALVLAYQAAAAVRAGRLEILLARFEPPPAPIQLVHASAQYPPASVRAFIDWIVERRSWDFTKLGPASRDPRAPTAGAVEAA